jgi:hypothetical protein
MRTIVDAKMKEYRVVWIQCPTSYNTPKVLFVEAENEKDAEAIVRDHIERSFGIEWFKVSVSEPKPVPAGRIIE